MGLNVFYNTVKLAVANTWTALQTFGAGLIDSTLTASRAVTTDASKQLVSSSTTATELGYVNGVTSAIQTQLNSKVGVTSQSVLSIVSDYTLTGAFGLIVGSSGTGLTLTVPSNGKLALAILQVSIVVTGNSSVRINDGDSTFVTSNATLFLDQNTITLVKLITQSGQVVKGEATGTGRVESDNYNSIQILEFS